MDPTLHTPRLKLTLVTTAADGTDELSWLHELRSCPRSMAWSIHPPSTHPTETQTLSARFLPSQDPNNKDIRIAYAVHLLPPNNDHHPTFIGLITLATVTATNLPLPPHLTIPKDQEKNTHVVELAYAFLPRAWGNGYATESLSAVLTACRAQTSAVFGAERVWMRVIVNGRNPASVRVMRKMGGEGVGERGVYVWRGEAIYVGGEWRTEDELVIFGGWVCGEGGV